MLAAARSPDQVLALGVWEPPMVAYDWWEVADVIEHTLAWGERDDAMQVGEDINRMILGEERWEALRPETHDLLCREGAAFRADMATQATALFDLDDLVVPFLVGRGTEMGPAFISGADELARRAGAETFVGVGVDHYAHLNAPDTWAELVRRTIALATSSG
jgi:hypothetical protein